MFLCYDLNNMNKFKVGVFGATGEVGREIINVLHKTEFPVETIRLYAGKSAGSVMKTPYGECKVEDANKANYSELDIAFWAISGDWSKENYVKTKNSDCYIIDNSTAFRREDDIPLIIPEINGDVLMENTSKLIANPNCTTAIAAIPISILNNIAGIKKLIFSTYQAASGAGYKGRMELLEQSKNYLNEKPVTNKEFDYPLPFNVIPRIDTFQDNDYTREEMKINWETRKILRLDDDVKISSTCVRVPVERSHSEDITVETEKPVTVEEYKEALSKEPMVKVYEGDEYPMPINSKQNYQTGIGRIRKPEVFENGIRFFVSGDQLLRGAALNAVLIAKKLHDLDKI